jgi:hypothetical protein
VSRILVTIQNVMTTLSGVFGCFDLVVNAMRVVTVMGNDLTCSFQGLPYFKNSLC